VSVFLKARQRLLSTLGSPSSLQQVSDRSYELCPAESQNAPPAICLQRDLDRVTGVMEVTTIEQEMRRIQGGPRKHGATVAYELSNVELSDGFLFKSGWKDRLLENPPHTSGPKETLPHATLTGTFFGARYFGHWMTDDLTLAMAAEKTGQPFTPERPLYTHEEGYLRLFQLQPKIVASARFEKLTILDDIGQNAYKKQRYQEMRRRLSAARVLPESRRVYIHRGGSGASRLLQNESAIEELLETLGFAILDPGRLAPEEIVAQSVGAEIIIGVEGSQLAHAFYAIADHGVMCALQPPYRFNNIFKDQADCVGFHYALLTGEAAEGGFRIELDEIRELVDRLSNLIA
jgi:hypothetical protein